MKSKKLFLVLLCTTFVNLTHSQQDIQTLIEHTKNSIANASSGRSKLNSQVLNIEGLSSPKVRHFLNNICSMPNTSYLEIGVWRGSTFISALYNNAENISQAIGIDNWSQFGGPAQTFINNTNALLSKNAFSFYDVDCFQADKEKIFNNLVNVYFYDGDHRAEDQSQAFTYYNDIFADTFIAIIDDWNHPPVQEGTRAAFKELNYKILFEQIMPARYNGDTENWWNGLYIAVIAK